MAKLELLVGADVFWRRAAADCANARRRLHVQAMTFEGDAAGLAVADAIRSSQALDRRVLVDAYTRVVISDRWVGWPLGWLPADLRAETLATKEMFRTLIAGGVKVRVTNPFDLTMSNYPARNHKKLIIADDIAYLGGVNFSDHNFAWRDFMLRVEGEEAVAFLAQDFQATWEGAPVSASRDLDGLRLIALDGRNNHSFFQEIADILAAARREIVVMSAYLTFPFTRPLADAAHRGVSVKLITPWRNNKPLVRDYLLGFAHRHGFDAHVVEEMSHVKGMLVDGEALIVGSCNFDFVGLASEEELVAVVRAPALIEEFRAQLIDSALAEKAENHGTPPLGGRLAHIALKVAEFFARAQRGAPRTAIDWS